MSLWLSIELPQLPLDALLLAQDARERLLVYAQKGSRRWIVGSAHPRIAIGEALGSVQARFPDLQARARDLGAESAALQAVALLAYGLSDRIVIVDDAPRGLYDPPHQSVNVDVAPSLRLFGGIEAMLERAHALLPTLPYRTRIGVAPTLTAAMLAARAGLPPLTDPDPQTVRAQLSVLPLRLLRWPFAAEEVLAGSGHATLGDVLRHGASSLAARLGAGFPLALQRLLGEAPDPRPWFTPPARYRRRHDLDVEIEDWQALLFPLQRLFDEFETYLRARQVAVTELHLSLARRRTETEIFVLRTTSPTQSADLLFRLLRERWQSQGPTAPARELRLRADRFVDLSSTQTQLFDDGNAQGEVWMMLVDRIRARLGDAALWQPGLADDHRPEHAWMRNGAPSTGQAPSPRPLWLLRAPRRFRPQGSVIGSPERISGGWWDGACVDRDYYRLADGKGANLWIFHNRADGQWYEHGRWD